MKIVPGRDEDRGGRAVVQQFLDFSGRKSEPIFLPGAFRGDAFGGADAAPGEVGHFRKHGQHDEAGEISRTDEAYAQVGGWCRFGLDQAYGAPRRLRIAVLDHDAKKRLFAFGIRS